MCEGDQVSMKRTLTMDLPVYQSHKDTMGWDDSVFHFRKFLCSYDGSYTTAVGVALLVVLAVFVLKNIHIFVLLRHTLRRGYNGVNTFSCFGLKKEQVIVEQTSDKRSDQHVV